MKRYLQLTITEPLEPASTIDERVQIKSAVIGIDLHTGHVTLPGGFVCTLQGLVQVVYRIEIERGLWIQSRYLKDRRL
jgi:hypothetical protein